MGSNPAKQAQLSDEARKAKAAYNREWRKKNPEKVAAQQERYWSKKARQAKEGGSDAGE